MICNWFYFGSNSGKCIREQEELCLLNHWNALKGPWGLNDCLLYLIGQGSTLPWCQHDLKKVLWPLLNATALKRQLDRCADIQLWCENSISLFVFDDFRLDYLEVYIIINSHMIHDATLQKRLALLTFPFDWIIALKHFFHSKNLTDKGFQVIIIFKM